MMSKEETNMIRTVYMYSIDSAKVMRVQFQEIREFLGFSAKYGELFFTAKVQRKFAEFS